MNQEEQYTDFVKRFEDYCKEYSTLKDATYAALKEAILLNTFTNEITESQIAKLLQISRTPIREAMLQLSSDGLLEISHGRKAKIRSLTNKDIQDLSIVLADIHRLALMLCIDHATSDDITDMEESIALISFYTKRKDIHHLHKYDSRFHTQIARASKNIWLLDIMDRLLSYTSVFREYAISRPNRMEAACKEHIAIFDAICKRDKEEASKLIANHVQNAFSQPQMTTAAPSDASLGSEPE